MQRESASRRTQRILSEATRDIVFAMLQKYQDASKRTTSHCVTSSTALIW